MPPGLRSVTVIDLEGNTVNVDNVIGIDESGDGGSGYYVTVAVRCSREDDIELVEKLIQNDLQPFKHKSSSIIKYGRLTPEERIKRTSSFLENLDDTSITWAAVVCESNLTNTKQAAAAAMAVKKSITHGLTTGDVAHGCGATAAVHDGDRDRYSDYQKILREQLSGRCDDSFQRSICSVYLAFLQEADLTYPQPTAADYIAGHIRNLYDNEGDFSHEWVYDFDPSWIDAGPQPDPIYRLDGLRPVRGEELRSRVIAWVMGKGKPQDPQPTGRDPYRNLINQIENEIVYKYLADLE